MADHLDLALQHAGQVEDEQMRRFVENMESTRRATPGDLAPLWC
ncbi:MAG: hypothetical protein R3E79_60340 [Caldilineaceae bacterium]